MYIGNSHPRWRRWSERQTQMTGVQLRVLVVDDDENAAAALETYLTLQDIVCRVAFGGLDAIATATRWLPDLILMDISMPQCNGVEAAQALRQSALTSDIVIIAHTALDEAEVRRHAIGLEFDGYFQKAQPIEQLVKLMMAFCSRTPVGDRGPTTPLLAIPDAGQECL